MTEFQAALSGKIKTGEFGEVNDRVKATLHARFAGFHVDIRTNDGSRYRGTVNEVSNYSFTIDTWVEITDGVFGDKVVVNFSTIKSIKGSL